jgi:hypothetical protein
MKTLLAAATILAALSAPAFAETAGTDARGSDHGSFRLSQQDPITAERQHAMAQGVKMSVHSYGSYNRRR